MIPSIVTSLTLFLSVPLLATSSPFETGSNVSSEQNDPRDDMEKFLNLTNEYSESVGHSDTFKA